MSRSTLLERRIFRLTLSAACCSCLATQIPAPKASAGGPGSRPGIVIHDENGQAVPAAAASAASQIFDVMVGPNNSFVFSPSNLKISTGDTVRWTWASDFHSVSSGDNCTADNQFCSPNNTKCSLGALNNTGFVYQFTFTQPGTYSYYCAAHCFSGMTGTVEVTAGPSCVPPPSNIISWWAAEGNALDSVGTSHGTLQGGAGFAAGQVGQAFNFDGTSAFIAVPHNDNLNPTGPFTVQAWVKADSQQSAPRSLIIDKSHGFSDSTGWVLQTEPDGTGCFSYGTGGAGNGDFHSACTQATILDDQWHHLAGVWTGTEIRIYEDGALQNTLAFSTPPANNSREVRIGASWGGGTPTRFFHGLVDEAQYFNRALSQSEIQAIVNAGSAGQCRPALFLTNAASSKVHGSAGTFDIPLPLAGEPAVECRSGGGAHTLVFSFSNNVATGSASVMTGIGSVSGSPTLNGNIMTVNLTGVSDVQKITVNLSNVTDSFGQVLPDTAVSMNVLAGDVNGNKTVNASDVGQTKLQSGAPVTAANFRQDVAVSGTINASDIGLVKSRSGQSVP